MVLSALCAISVSDPPAVCLPDPSAGVGRVSPATPLCTASSLMCNSARSRPCPTNHLLQSAHSGSATGSERNMLLQRCLSPHCTTYPSCPTNPLLQSAHSGSATGSERNMLLQRCLAPRCTTYPSLQTVHATSCRSHLLKRCCCTMTCFAT